MSNSDQKIQNNSQLTEQFGIKYNNIQSSLKYFNFEGMDKDKIIEKYEEVVCQREKQIRELAYEIGVINEKLENGIEKIKILEEENKNLNNKLLKKNTLLEQELTNKDIMFIKLNNLQNENDKLMQKLQSGGIDYNSDIKKEKKSIWSGIFGKTNKQEEKKPNEFYNTNTNIPMVIAKDKEKEIERSNQNKPIENKPLANTDDINTKKLTNSVIFPASSSNNTNLVKSNNNLSSSISAMLTPDLLNSIDLQSNLMNIKSNPNNATPLNTNIQLSSKNPMNRNPLRDPKGGSANRISLSALDKRLASESIDYEPVFK